MWQTHVAWGDKLLIPFPLGGVERCLGVFKEWDTGIKRPLSEWAVLT